jgi:tRNA A-37 threonylcarbamoyl transferase component Bud32
MKQRFSHGSWWKPALLLLMVAGILLLNPGLHLQHLLEWLFNRSRDSSSPGRCGKGDSSSIQLQSRICHALWRRFPLLCWRSGGLAFEVCPQLIITGPRGLRYKYRSLIGKVDKDLPWSDLTEIRLERKLNSASTLSDCVIFKTDKRSLKLKLDNFKTGQDKEKLLHAIESFAPSVPRDAAIMEVLALPADHSYTEVWMTALSAPPKRERLKPLTADAVMNEGNYTVVKELGSGGQGFAYLAKDKEDKEVVLKEFVLPIYVDIQARRKALERFENEARLLSRLDNPQVVKLRGFFIEDHRAYLVLEHIDGKNLRQIVAEKGHFSEEETKVLLAKMCKILSYLHSLEPPLVHRDFTPDNLILDKDGNLKLIDFNVAQEMQDGTTGTVVGKQAYLPPEQFRGQAEPASDVYAMGATLYYLLTGKDPTPISTLRVAKELPDLDPQLDQLMTQLTSMDPALRPTADEVLKGQEQAKAED